MRVLNPNTMHKNMMILDNIGTQRQEEKKQKLISDFGHDMLTLLGEANTPKEVKEGQVKLSQKYKDKNLPIKEQAFWANKIMERESTMRSNKIQDKAIAQKDMLFNQGQEKYNQQKSDDSILGQLRNPKEFAGGQTYPQGVEGEYSVPADQETLLGGLSNQGRNQYEDQQYLTQQRGQASSDRIRQHGRQDIADAQKKALFDRKMKETTAKPRNLSITDETKITEALVEQSYKGNGYVFDKSMGTWNSPTGGISPEEAIKIEADAKRRAPTVIGLIKNNNMSLQGAIETVNKHESLLKQKQIKDLIKEALASPDIETTIRQIQDPEIAQKVRNGIIIAKKEEEDQKKKKDLFGSYNDVIKSGQEQLTADPFGRSTPISTLR